MEPAALVFDIAINKTLHSAKRSFALQVALRSTSQRLIILGPSGSGKSQTLQAIAGLSRPDSGHVRVAGATFFDAAASIDLSPQARQVGYLFQDYALFPHLNVRQNIAFGLVRGLRNPPAASALPAVEHWLQAFDLLPLAQQFPDELSGGQRQRVALARTLATQPRALLLDEPFAALDGQLRETVRAQVDALQRHLQVPMVLVTHDPEDARVFGGHSVQLLDGRMVESSG